MKPTVLFGSGFVGSPAQQKIVVDRSIKPVSERRGKKMPVAKVKIRRA